jgi:hypothetical protein
MFLGALLAPVGRLELGGWDITDRLEQSAVVEPVDPLERGVLDVVDALPRSTPADQLGLVEPDDRLCEGVVIGIALDPTEFTAPCSPRRSE